MGKEKLKKYLVLLFRFGITLAAVVFIVVFILVPLIVVFYNALRNGVGFYLGILGRDETLSALLLTFEILLIVLPLNLVFGIACAWYVTKYDFYGKRVLVSLLDLPFTVSPVVAGTMFVMLYSVNGLLGGLLEVLKIKVVFAFPGLVLATLFVTFPFIARELIAVMEEQGQEMEEAGRMLGADGWQILFRITLPNVKWGLFYGVILCTARCVGEFGAVSIVSGHIRGKTITVPLEVEILYNEYNLVGAFSVASILCTLGVITLVLRRWMEKKDRGMRREVFYGD